MSIYNKTKKDSQDHPEYELCKLEEMALSCPEKSVVSVPPSVCRVY